MAPSQILLQWVNIIKPLLDAYKGQLITEINSDTGLNPLLLVCRIILFAISGGNALQRSSNQPLSYNAAGKLEFLNLSILPGGTLFLKSWEEFSVVQIKLCWPPSWLVVLSLYSLEFLHVAASYTMNMNILPLYKVCCIWSAVLVCDQESGSGW